MDGFAILESKDLYSVYPRTTTHRQLSDLEIKLGGSNRMNSNPKVCNKVAALLLCIFDGMSVQLAQYGIYTFVSKLLQACVTKYAIINFILLICIFIFPALCFRFVFKDKELNIKRKQKKNCKTKPKSNVINGHAQTVILYYYN